MKKTILFVVLLLVQVQVSSAQSSDIQQLLLNVEKLSQFRQILNDMKKGYEILDKGYSTIKDISQGNFSLHKAFLDGLLNVSPTVRNYRKIGEIVSYQSKVVGEYRDSFARFRSDGNFNPQELGYIAGVYDRLLNESLRNLDELLLVVTAGKMRMSDDDRLKEIDRIHGQMQHKLQFLRTFNTNTAILAIQRLKERNDVHRMIGIYGINN